LIPLTCLVGWALRVQKEDPHKPPHPAHAPCSPPAAIHHLAPPLLCPLPASGAHPALQIKNSAESENLNWILANTKPCPKCT